MNELEMTASGELPLTLEGLQSLFKTVSHAKRIWESTFDAIVDPVMVVSRDYRVERINFAAAQSAQLDVREFNGKICYEVFAKRSSPCVGCPLISALQSKTSQRSTLKPYADHREFLASAYPIRTKEGESLDLAVLQYQDLTRIRKLEEQLLQSEKMAALGLLASGIAHDINNPLSGVLAFAQMALQDVPSDSRTYQDLREIEQSALRCKKIIEDLLSFARPISKVDRKPTDLREVLKRVLPNLQVQWKHLDYQLKLDLPPVPLVSVSESKFEQVFTNLLSNALQSLDAGGIIRVGTRHEPGWLLIEVEDSGKGIPEHQIHQIFDPYFTTKREKGGTGLGLPICYNIVREHGGRIEVKSRLGQGSLFKIYLPMDAHFELEEQAAKSVMSDKG